MNAKRSKQSSKQDRHSASPVSSDNLPRDIQQKCLDIFRHALWTSSDDLQVVQQVKTHLYNRDFAAAFSQPAYLQAYALRWSASRALCYGTIFSSLQRYVDDSDQASLHHVICLGGGAGAELVGLAAWLNSSSMLSLSAHLVDIADWTAVSSKLYASLSEQHQLSRYASASAKENNSAFIEKERLLVEFVQADVLNDQTRHQWLQSVKQAKLITIMFALNELYSTSMPRTQALLRTLTSAARPGTLFLVVDSPGSYSTVTLNGSKKKYPMQWLLDHTLIGPPNTSQRDQQWIKLTDEASQWFRLPEDLRYPVELENMRYQLHLYRRQQTEQTSNQ